MKNILKIFLFFFFMGCYPVYAQSQNFDRIITLLETGKPDSAAVILYGIIDGEGDKNYKVRAYYYLALAMRQLGRQDEEFQYLISALDRNPDDGIKDKILYEYSQILLDTGDYDNCIKTALEFRHNFENSPMVPDILDILGEAYLAQKEYLRAFNSFNEITKLFPETEKARNALKSEGICLYKLDLISGAVEHLEDYIEKMDPENESGEALYYLGLSYERLNQYDSAAEAFKRLTLEYPSYSGTLDAFFRLGENYFLTGKYIEAENAFVNYSTNAGDKDERRDEAYFYLERIMYKTGKYRNENQIAENFVAKYPKSKRSPKLLFDLARYYHLSGNFQEALEKYKILLNNPFYKNYADSAVVSIADMYISENRYAEAEFFLKNVIKETTELSIIQVSYMKLGSLEESRDRYDEAIAWYDSSLEINASSDYNYRSMYGTGRVYQSMNRWNDAAKVYEKMIKRFPVNSGIVDIYLRLSDVYLIQGRLKDAIRNAQESIKIAKGRKKTDILLFVAELYEETDEERALQLYTSIFNNNQNSPVQISKALMCYADLSESRGETNSALDAYMKIVSSDSDSVLVRKAKEKIAIIKDNTEN